MLRSLVGSEMCIRDSHWTGGGKHMFCIGIACGACSGYEVYALLNEMVHLARGRFRADMMVHHAVALVFIVGSGTMFTRVDEGDIKYWMFVWESLTFSMVSNLTLNLRNYSLACLKRIDDAGQQGTAHKSATVWVNVLSMLFGVSFLWVRVVEQLPFIVACLTGPVASAIKNRANPFVSLSTAAVYSAWMVLTALNLYWAVYVFNMGLRVLGLSKQKKSKQL
eukprot:TRINITY_DN11129_c0_g1_i2.p1 TRINITY_DN11129_c0_g1~~TRINITY_DN11129_c0_g1_i2.p1  ORF type:complete len:245 (+),score=57.23 TRINITY_DN11129_c0_g1_i2:70-735(+)